MTSATNLKHENDVLTAIQNIVEADDGSGNVVDRDGDPLTDSANSMVELVDSSNPIPMVDWDQLAGASIPVSAMDVADINYLSGQGDRWLVTMRFDAWAPKRQGSVASALANRIEDIINSNNFADEGLDISVVSSSRNRDPVPDEGAKRVSLRMDLKLKR